MMIALRACHEQLVCAVYRRLRQSTELEQLTSPAAVLLLHLDDDKCMAVHIVLHAVVMLVIDLFACMALQ